MKTSALPPDEDMQPTEDTVVLVQKQPDGTFKLVLATVDEVADAKLKEAGNA